MMVEDDLVDLRIERQGLELAEPRGVDGLDDDQAPDRVELEPGSLDHEVQLVCVQAVELPDIPIQRSRQADDGAWIEPARRQHCRERVEIGVRVGGDDCFRTHGGNIVAYACATASISTLAPDGSAATWTVARAGGASPTWR